MQLHFHLHAPVKWARLTPYQRESKCASFPLRANKASRGTGLQGGSGDSLALLSNISIEKVLRIINYVPVVLINAGLVLANIPNADKAAVACSDFRRASLCGHKARGNKTTALPSALPLKWGLEGARGTTLSAHLWDQLCPKFSLQRQARHPSGHTLSSQCFPPLPPISFISNLLVPSCYTAWASGPVHFTPHLPAPTI